MLFRNVHRTVWRPSFLCRCQCNSTFPHPAQTSHATTEGDQRIRRRDFKHLSVEDKHKFRLSKIKAQQQKKVIRERAVFAALSDAEKREFKTRKILERERSQQRMKDAMESGYKVCVDLTLDENTHNDHDRSGLLNQLKHGYTFMKKSASPFHLHLTGVHTEINDLIVQRGFNNWHCTMQAESAWNWMADRRSDIVLLSPDAPEVLETIESDKIYIINGIVDRTVKPKLSLKLAERNNISAKRLPIQDYIPHRQTHILNVNTMMEIFCLYKEYNGDWKRTLESAMPLRKLNGKSPPQQ